MTTSVDRLAEDIWAAFLDTSRLQRYYHAQSEFYRRLHYVIRSIMLLSASASVAAFFDVLANWVQLTAALVLAIVVVLDHTLDAGKKTFVCAQASIEFEAAVSDYRDLWRRFTALDHDDVTERHLELEASTRQASARVVAVGANTSNVRLNERCAKEAYEVEGRQYAAA